MTPEYVKRAELEWVQRGDEWGWMDTSLDDSCWFLPPLCAAGRSPQFPVWAGWPGMKGTEFLDHQYIYDAHQFLDLSGGRWQVYRKNIQKFPKRVNGDLIYRGLNEEECEDEITDLLLKWSEGRTVQDPDTMVRFFLDGWLRWGLFLDNRLVGVNVGDMNWQHVLFRYCIDDGTPFLNEYMRHCFFTSSFAQTRRWVNDGGDLGNEDLAHFKRKLNPVEVSEVWTH